MKADYQSNLDQTSPSLQNSSLKTCSAPNPATHVCCSKTCDKIAYICDLKSCQCRKDHSQCPFLQIQSIMNSLKAKILPFNHYQEAILDKIDKTIDQLSDLKDKVQKLIKQNLSLYGLTVKDKNLYEALNQQKVTGKQIIKLFVQTMSESNSFVEKEFFDTKFGELWKSIDTQIQLKSSKLIQLLESFSVQDQKLLYNLKLFEGTRIAINQNDTYNLLKMFNRKQIKSAKLIYRASQNNFSTQKFHEKCDSTPHTLTLCETVHEKVIGGYTPLLWNHQNGAKLKDESGESFIFSLTNNDKFTLDKSKDAIYPHNNIGPAFGSGSPDFYLTTSANSNSSSHAQICKSYHNPNYTASNGDSYMKFTGNPEKNYYFNAKEWEVWQLEFV